MFASHFNLAVFCSRIRSEQKAAKDAKRLLIRLGDEHGRSCFSLIPSLSMTGEARLEPCAIGFASAI
jgi:hypothetical protein